MSRMILTVSALLILAGAALAAETPPAPVEARAEAAVPSVAPLTPEQIEARRLAAELRKAMNAEIHARVDAERSEVAALVAELETAATSEQRHEIQRRIHAAKEQGRRDLLAIQLDYARQGGHEQQVRELEAMLTRLEQGPAKSASGPSVRASRRGGESR